VPGAPLRRSVAAGGTAVFGINAVANRAKIAGDPRSAVDAPKALDRRIALLGPFGLTLFPAWTRGACLLERGGDDAGRASIRIAPWPSLEAKRAAEPVTTRALEFKDA